MKLLIKRVEGLTEDNLPKRANAFDAGYDIVATSDPIIVGQSAPEHGYYYSIDYIEYKTNLSWTPKPQINTQQWIVNGEKKELIYDRLDYHIELFPRSSISKKWLSLCNSVGVIDMGYNLPVLARFFYRSQPCDFKILQNRYATKINFDKIYKRGEKIIQMKPRLNMDIEFEFVDELPKVDSRAGGFGSTDKI